MRLLGSVRLVVRDAARRGRGLARALLDDPKAAAEPQVVDAVSHRDDTARGLPAAVRQPRRL